MPNSNLEPVQAAKEIERLKNRLEETEETLRAIRQYMVDAFVVTREQGEQVVTLSDADFPYRTMVESMNEGAVTLIPDGTIFYSNPCFARMIHTEPEKLLGSSFRDLVLFEDMEAFDTVFAQAKQTGAKGELHLKTANGDSFPAQLSLYQVGVHNSRAISIILSDISERVRAEQKIRSLASKLTLVEQEERHRISQVLHDDLQQRLFAIKAQLSFLKDATSQHELSAAAYQEIDQIQTMLSESISITRNLSIDLNPVVVHGEGLTEAMTWLSFRMKEQYGLHIDLVAKDNLSHLEHHARLVLFQAVRELLFNVVKHAGVLEARVTLEQVDGHGRITVSDEGKGFDVDAVMSNVKTAHGLLVVQDRLSLLGFSLHIQSSPNGGTQVVIEAHGERISDNHV